MSCYPSNRNHNNADQRFNRRRMEKFIFKNTRSFIFYVYVVHLVHIFVSSQFYIFKSIFMWFSYFLLQWKFEWTFPFTVGSDHRTWTTFTAYKSWKCEIFTIFINFIRFSFFLSIHSILFEKFEIEILFVSPTGRLASVRLEKSDASG